MICSYAPSPLGDLLLVRGGRDAATGTPGGLTGVFLPTGRHARTMRDGWRRDDAAFEDVRGQLDQYFAGERREFALPLRAAGTAFQQRVWTALADIPYGRTATYATIAAAIGAPTAFRAVGLANSQNPLSVIVPCHRVIGANGSLTGYSGGLAAKQWLLSHEAVRLGEAGPVQDRHRDAEPA